MASAHDQFCDDVAESVRVMASRPSGPHMMTAPNIDWGKVKSAAAAAAGFYLNAVPLLDATFPGYKVFVDGAAAAIAVAMGLTPTAPPAS